MTTPEDPWRDYKRDADDLTVPLSLRVSPSLAAALRAEANRRHLVVSELVRRTLIAALSSENDPPHDDSTLTVADVEQIARRVVREELDAP